MATSSIEIANKGLRLIGANPITAFTDETDPARMAQEFYDLRLEYLLFQHNWNFAQVRVELAEVAGNPVDIDGVASGHWFQLPTNCLYVQETDLDTEESWRIEGRRLITDAGSVAIIYVALVTDVNTYSKGFVQALVDDLAAHFTYPLTRNAALAELMFKKAEMSLSKAKSRDGQEGRHLKRFLSDSLTKVR